MAWPDYTVDVNDRVKALLRPSTSAVNPAWLASSVADALATCQTDALAAWVGRGYSYAQVEAWAAGPGKPHLISTAFFLVCIDSRTDLRDENDVKVEPSAVLDRRCDWLTMPMVDASGNLVDPANVATAGGILFGTVTHDNETFRYSDGTRVPW